ncbi:WxL protein peptidoglycan domain-containing protein [Herbiconiux daphne]|uniref:WxL protein peptidoglycan domain-containing protein n=1 Tax=Herbiconiux daphne TaxID=2970914 RepID=UPI0028772978|nr:DUF916 domain-containing protein [Herbiconiux daphne]
MNLRAHRPAPATPVAATPAPATPAFRSALVAALVVLGLAVAPVASASAADADVTWGVRTSSNDQGADRQNYDYAVDPGGQVTDGLIISNHDDAPLDLDVYAADGFTTTSGQLDVVTRDTASTEVGAWVTLGKGHVQVPAGESVEVPFTLTVPENATPGDYAGGVLTSLAQPGQEEGITVDRRLGIRIHLRVGGELAPALAVENMRVDYTGTLNPFGTGDATVSYTLHNTGNVRLAAGQAVTLTGPFGLLPVTASGVDAAPELLPGETWNVTVPVAGVFPAFVLSATAVITPERSGQDAGIDLTTVEAGASTAAVPWALLVLVLLVAAAVVGAVLITRRRRRRQKRVEDARVAEAVEQALRERESTSSSAV